ncbi:hypothetical protein U14_05565 [Candidatus Moduliflexus flocculans]|uniref:Uncharacterized protein n=1 Tax=Candidatus Moduliflexus flocculans TaxID=1499966 RepID=A0A081BSA4_9BACT|nr:hypothetical protein U14_05565 [Candidatus Moduliflexus flocculans]
MRLKGWLKKSIALCACTILGGMIASLSFAQNIQLDFEAFPPGKGVPADEMEVSEQYKDSHGVTFIIDQDGNPNTTNDRSKPLLEDRGGSNENSPETGDLKGFRNDKLGVVDIEAAAYQNQLGNFFLKLNTDAPAGANLLIEFL